jgi:hypothetical protein
MKKALVVASTLVATLSVLATVRATAGTYDWAAGLPGCDPSRPAVAHQDGTVLAPQPKDGPVPCGMTTGWPSIENRIEVTNTNTVFFDCALKGGGPFLGGTGDTPAWGSEEGMALSTDEGLKWQHISIPVWPDLYVLDGQTDNNVYVDHDTGRLFVYMQNSGPVGISTFCGGGGGATVAYSDDSGTKWDWAFDNDHSCAENPTVLTGKPTISDLSQAPYPNVVYLCGDNTSSGAATVGTPGYSCSKSITGGTRWKGTTVAGLGVLTGPQGFYSGIGKDRLDPYAECGTNSSSAGAGVQPLSHAHGALPAGTLLVVMSCGGSTYLSHSTDEGATWKVLRPIPHGGSLRVDSADNLYLLSAMKLSHSTDLGATWSPERDMKFPDVASVGTLLFAQGTYADGQVGHVAVTYYGKLGTNTASDAFITETRDALDDDPLFWTGQVNDPNRHLLTGVDIGLTVTDIIGGALSPDGRSVWGSWVQDCGNALTDPSCLSRLPGTNPALPQDGFAGRLVWHTSALTP